VGALALTPQNAFQRYVALGTSNSQGAQSGGISAAAQRAAWPAQLAARVGVPFSLPLVQDPGCSPPLRPPLAANIALLAAFSAFGAGDDLVGAIMTTCMPLVSGIVPPTNNVAISGADVHDALTATIASATLGAGKPLLPRRIVGSSLQLASAERLNTGFVQLRYDVTYDAAQS
jgi:hypothetical protein